METFKNITLHYGDCKDILPQIEDRSCDMALVDLPYGCLNKGNKHAAWDKELPLDAKAFLEDYFKIDLTI